MSLRVFGRAVSPPARRRRRREGRQQQAARGPSDEQSPLASSSSSASRCGLYLSSSTRGFSTAVTASRIGRAADGPGEPTSRTETIGDVRPRVRPLARPDDGVAPVRQRARDERARRSSRGRRGRRPSGRRSRRSGCRASPRRRPRSGSRRGRAARSTRAGSASGRRRGSAARRLRSPTARTRATPSGRRAGGRRPCGSSPGRRPTTTHERPPRCAASSIRNGRPFDDRLAGLQAGEVPALALRRVVDDRGEVLHLEAHRVRAQRRRRRGGEQRARLDEAAAHLGERVLAARGRARPEEVRAEERLGEVELAELELLERGPRRDLAAHAPRRGRSVPPSPSRRCPAGCRSRTASRGA